MKILAIDPGTTTGWCLYSTDSRCALSSGQFPGAEASHEFYAVKSANPSALCVIERPMGYGPTYPQVVDAAWYAGELRALTNATPITRREIKAILTEATQCDVRVKDDASAWAALKLLHGGEACAKKGGALYGVKAHERAALAVAVAFAIKQAQAAATGAPA